ncbi:gamma-glutamyltransferase family protein [Micromonospora orduensis]|uniref:Gamma-glutamyltransferase family protein n=1 Tax=Micromonospora orduensis TaxID=1420891 RepID=A0A5C4QD03_9ACTN|nr:gamma-glutamyltransferase [Micromonospora orduensis]TNH22690.1 gamma-glutamyltransferase family protein [Micromonospora orduensis]
MAVLERGGNAFDAAVAAGFVLQVVEPHYNGPGGDLSIVLHSAVTGETTAICGQGPVPAAATLDRFLALGLGQVPGSGLLPATVPGAFGGWMRLLAEFGTMRLADVLSYAIGYAERGFPLLAETANAIGTLAPLFLTEWTGSASTYLSGERAPTAGSRFRNPALARTYRRIVEIAEAASPSRESQIEAAHEAFYQGFVAEAIDTFVARTEAIDATGRRHRGFLTGQDLADWQPQVEPAAGIDYRGHSVHKPGPWSQGPVFLQQLALLKGFDVTGMGLGSAEYIHTVVECAKLAFADREAWYGDPLQSDVPLQTLLGDDYNHARRELVNKEASEALRPGSPDGREPWMPTPGPPDLQPDAEDWIGQLGNGLPTILPRTAARGDTCTVTVTDRAGNTVAATPSGGWLKSSPAIAELGFPLGTRGQTMWLVDGHPNSVAPGRRPRTTLSPTVVLREGRSYVSFGTPGGDRQDQWTLLFLLGVLDFGLDSQSATETLAFHSDAIPASFTPRESYPRRLTVEGDCPPEVVAELQRRNHEVQLVAEKSLGKVCATGLRPDNGFVFASASPRGRQAYAVSR